MASKALRLLPPNRELGWTPYAWLIYLSMFLVYPALRRAGAIEWAATLLGVAAFLVLYFRGYWLCGRRLLAVIAGIALLGVLFSPWNPWATVFFVYAGAFAGQVGPPRQGARVLAVLALVLVAEAWLAPIPPDGWIPGLVFTLLIGAINIHFAEVSRANGRLRLAQEEIERLATVAERERIGRDLHDLLGHTLSLITLKAELAGRLLARDPRDLAAAAREIHELEGVSRRALAEVRDAVAGIRAAGLAEELARARQVCTAAGVALAVEGELEVEGAAETALALALREAVTNVVRHAGASACRIRLAEEDGGVRLEVWDDGRGGLAPDGAGLAGMRERVEALGGRVERAEASASGAPEREGARGTRLAVWLPVVEPAREALRAAAGAAR